jgi:hypothetical protein
MKINSIIRIILFFNIILVLSIYFIYRPNSWPIGLEASGCLVSLILLSMTLLFLWIMKKKLIDDKQKKNLGLGLCFGLLWTIEISINNFIQPGLPLRDIIDNIFLGIITLLILITSTRDTYQSGKFLFGVKSGLWSGFASGVIACFTALILVVFGMRYILLDPLNIKEWSDLKETTYAPGMSVYFAYQTLTGAIMHLFILGILLGLILGSVGGVMGLALRVIKK